MCIFRNWSKDHKNHTSHSKEIFKKIFFRYFPLKKQLSSKSLSRHKIVSSERTLFGPPVRVSSSGFIPTHTHMKKHTLYKVRFFFTVPFNLFSDAYSVSGKLNPLGRPLQKEPILRDRRFRQMVWGLGSVHRLESNPMLEGNGRQ